MDHHLYNQSQHQYHHPHHEYSSSAIISNELNERQHQHNHQRQHYDENGVGIVYDYSTTPPPHPPPKTKSKKLLKSPLAAIKNAFIRTTRPLRRQSSMIESDKKSRTNFLRRQHSLMEQRHVMIDHQDVDDPYYQQPSSHHQHHHHRSQQYGDYSDPRYPTRHEPFYPPNDGGGGTYQNLESESIYGYTGSTSGGYDQEHLYSNRALIELERDQNQGKYDRNGGGATGGSGGGRIIRRHSLAERSTSYQPRYSTMQRSSNNRDREISEPIYQTRGGSYMMENGATSLNSGGLGGGGSGNGVRISRNRSRSRGPTTSTTTADDQDYLTYQNNRRSESIYANRREMHRDHLYQSRSEMQERINIGKREINGRGGSSATTTTTTVDVIVDPIYQSRRELKENGFKTRTQLREHLYQTRRDAMESMAEPIYVSKREAPIYEMKESVHELKDDDDADCSLVSEVMGAVDKLELSARPEPSGQEQDDDIPMIDEQQQREIVVEDVNETATGSGGSGDTDEDTLTNNNQSDLQKTVVETPLTIETPLSPRSIRSPYHISSMIKRTAPPQLPLPPPPPLTTCNESPSSIAASRTSVETQYNSQMSLPIGLPNAQSTPFASELSIQTPLGDGIRREPSITRGVFSYAGGTLSDPIWNVSLIIPEGAIPKEIQQEIYFKISDPRCADNVVPGGPPLDMENGL